MSLGRTEDAKRVLTVAYDAYQAALGSDHDKTKRIAARLVEIHRTSGDPEQTAQWQTKLAE